MPIFSRVELTHFILQIDSLLNPIINNKISQRYNYRVQKNSVFYIFKNSEIRRRDLLNRFEKQKFYFIYKNS